MSTDILDAINETLEWYSSGDSMRSQPATPFPPLGTHWVNVVRRLCAQTGLDGYTAWLLAADVAEYEAASPFAEIVGRAQRGPRLGRGARAVALLRDPVRRGCIGLHTGAATGCRPSRPRRPRWRRPVPNRRAPDEQRRGR